MLQINPAAPAFARRSTSPTLEASTQGAAYACYPDSIGGVIVARLSDGWAAYLARGSEARGFYDSVYTAMDGKADFESDSEAFDRAASEFDGFMDSPASNRGRPGPDGDFWRWDSPAAKAA